MSFYTNAEGEYIMSPEQIRAEWAADERDSYERDPWEQDDYYMGGDEPECTPETHGMDADQQADGTWECYLCLEPCDEPGDGDDWDGMEDQWLDGSYEE